VEGHTDSVGTDELNMRLSENRANSVRDFLAKQGIVTSSIVSRGFGKSQPVATNDTAAGSRIAEWSWSFLATQSEARAVRP